MIGKKLLGHGPQPTTTTKVTTTSIPVVGSFDITNAGQLNDIAANQQAGGANLVAAKQTNVAGAAINAGGFLVVGQQRWRGRAGCLHAWGRWRQPWLLRFPTRSVAPSGTTCTPGAALSAAVGPPPL